MCLMVLRNILNFAGNVLFAGENSYFYEIWQTRLQADLNAACPVILCLNYSMTGSGKNSTGHLAAIWPIIAVSALVIDSPT